MVPGSPSSRELEKTAVSPGRKLQLAVDIPDLADALGALYRTAAFVDVIEVGTVLCLSRGLDAVRAVRAAHPRHVLLADIRIAEAGGVLARMAYEAGADWVTVVSGASPSTFAAVSAVAAQFGADVQVELSDGWDWDLVRRCLDLGIAQYILHRSRDAEAHGSLAWPQADLDAIARIHDEGGRVSVTGGMTVGEVQRFADLPVEIFIAGRAIYGSSDPAASAQEFRSTIQGLPPLSSGLHRPTGLAAGRPGSR